MVGSAEAGEIQQAWICHTGYWHTEWC